MCDDDITDVVEECLAEYLDGKELDQEIDTIEDEDPEEDPR